MALEAMLYHYELEVLHGVGGANINTERLSAEDKYFYCCGLVDRCLMLHLVPPVEGDVDRLTKVRQLASVNPGYIGVYAALRNLDQGYKFRIQGYPVPATIRDLLADFDLLVNDCIVATDVVCPPPPPGS